MMEFFNVAVIGGGAAGLSLAQMLGSAEKNEYSIGKKTVVFDNNKSDMQKASFFNVPGIEFGINGDVFQNKLIDNLKNFSSIEYRKENIIEITKINKNFQIQNEHNVCYLADIVVLACGYKHFKLELKNIDLEFLSSITTDKPRKVIKHNNYKIDENLYVCGTLADVYSQFVIVAGSGAQVALDILSGWAEKRIIIHDTIKKSENL